MNPQMNAIKDEFNEAVPYADRAVNLGKVLQEWSQLA